MAIDLRPQIATPDYSSLVQGYQPPANNLLSSAMQGFNDVAPIVQKLHQKKKWSDAIDSLVSQNPAMAQYAGVFKTQPELMGQMMPGIIKAQAMKTNGTIPIEQASQIAASAGNAEAATPLIQAAQIAGRDYLTKEEMANLFKTVNARSQADKGNYFDIMGNVNKGRLALATKQAAFGGKYGANQLALNTALGHVDTASQAFDGVKNLDERFLNVPINKLKVQTNDPNIVSLGISLNALKGELANVFKGSAGTDQEIGAWSDYLNENLTPVQASAAIQQVGHLLNSRMNALQYQQEQVAGNAVDPSKTLSPEAKRVVAGLAQPKPPPSGPFSKGALSPAQQALAAKLKL